MKIEIKYLIWLELIRPYTFSGESSKKCMPILVKVKENYCHTSFIPHSYHIRTTFVPYSNS